MRTATHLQPLTAADISTLNALGIDSFTQNGVVEYIGRTRNFRKRYQNHCSQGSKENTAAFAFRLARVSTKQSKASYKTEGSRKSLMLQPEFAEAFHNAKRTIREMEVRFVLVSDPRTQLLLELYASMELRSVHNDFGTT